MMKDVGFWSPWRHTAQMDPSTGPYSMLRWCEGKEEGCG
jgi:hypothetical protein